MDSDDGEYEDEYENVVRNSGWYEVEIQRFGTDWKWGVLWWDGDGWLTADGFDIPYIGPVRNPVMLSRDEWSA